MNYSAESVEIFCETRGDRGIQAKYHIRSYLVLVELWHCLKITHTAASHMLPPDIWVREGRSILSKDPLLFSWPASCCCWAKPDNICTMNECAAAEGRGTVFYSGHIYFLSSDARIHDLVKCKAERTQPEVYAVLNLSPAAGGKSACICKACKKAIADFSNRDWNVISVV